MAAKAVSAARFKTLPVKATTSIKDFVAKHKLEFKPGCGFYQLTKPENIQIYKEIVARKKTDGSFVSGDAVRKILGVPNDKKGKFKLGKDTLTDFDVFVQSTSYTRKLMAGSEFLYDTKGTGISHGDIASAKVVARKRLGDDDDDGTPGLFGTPGMFGSSGMFGSPAKKKAKTNTGPIKLNTDAVPPPPPGAGGSPIEIVFCFDTTGSMYACLAEVRKRVKEVVQRLLTDIPSIRIGLFACGDYCDRHSSYVTEFEDFSSDAKMLCKWVTNVGNSGGGDFEECYELAFHQIRTCMSWTGGTQRSLVMIGDACPHEPGDAANETGLDWRGELKLLTNQWGVRTYAVQCDKTDSNIGYMGQANTFWQSLADLSGGVLLNLTTFDSVIDLILAICYREQGAEQLKAYEAEVTKREIKRTGSGMNKALNDLFAALKAPDAALSKVSVKGIGKTTTDKAAAGLDILFPAIVATKPKGKGRAKPAAKKAAAKKPTAKKTATKKTAPKKTATKKDRKAPAKKGATVKKGVAKKTEKKKTAKKAAAKPKAATKSKAMTGRSRRGM